MLNIKKLLLLLFVVMMFISTNHILCFASEIEANLTLEEIDLPSNLNFTVNNTCTGHAYFMQASANTSGDFAIFSLHVDPNDYSTVDFKTVYIDIYRFDGSFLQELSFTTPLDLAFQLKENTVNIFFHSSVLVYDLTTQKLSHYAILKGDVVNDGLYKQLRSKEFTAGNWVYNYKKGFIGYVKLTRSNGNQVQVLVEMPGTGNLFGKVILPGSIFGIICIILAVWQIRKHKH